MSASGYFTTVGHKGCSPHRAGCTCTDTMKCHQVNHPEWWPRPGAGECRPDLSGYGPEFYPTTNCAGVVGATPGSSTYGGPPGRIGTGAGVGKYSMGFYKYYGPQNPKYAGFPARHCASTCDCSGCANMPISSNCQGKDSKDGHPCDCSFGNMRAGCWDDNCTGGNSTCDCTRCWNKPIGSKCKGIDSKIPGFACECGNGDRNVCWNYNCCYPGQKAPGPTGSAPPPVSTRPTRPGRTLPAYTPSYTAPSSQDSAIAPEIILAVIVIVGLMVMGMFK